MLEGQHLGIPIIPALLQGIGQAAGLRRRDQPSLLLLQFVARELGNSRLLLIGTYRDMELSRQHPLAESLGELTRERLFQRVLLRGLSQQNLEPPSCD